MARIAIVEDQKADSNVIQEYVNKYVKEFNVMLETVVFANGLNFLDEYDTDFDVVFMDIEMPHLDGIETAKKLREKDPAVALVFVTNMIQYAINGYEVDAVDFMVKPIGYYNFSKKLDKALNYSRKNQKRYLSVRKNGNVTVIPVNDIYYIDKNKNYVDIHTKQGTYCLRTTISEMEQKLSEYGFSKCYISCIVNLSHVEVVKTDQLRINGEWIPISRRNKREFLSKVADRLGGMCL